MAPSKQIEDMQARVDLPHIWRNHLMETALDDPLYFTFTVFCPNCAAYQLRGRALHNDWSRFSCCGGSMPCSGNCGESECPELCAAAEACFCFQCSVATTRFMIQDELRIQNTKCDNFIIAAMFWLQNLACLCNILACVTQNQAIGEAAVMTDRIAEVAYCSVCACMQTQHKLQMDERDGLIPALEGRTVRSAPGAQEMSKY